MGALKKDAVVEQDGELVIRDLPYKKGDHVQVILLGGQSPYPIAKGLSAKDLLNSPLVGLWADRQDIKDSSQFARSLREKAQRRE